MTPDELRAIEDRASAAAQGPWWAEGGGVYAPIEIDSVHVIVSAIGGGPGQPNCEFVAHARSDTPALITHVREQDTTIVQAFAMVCASDQALVAIRQVLGPGPGCSENGCRGCTWEMNEAYRLSVGVVGPYVRKGKTAPTAGPGHDLAARVLELEAELEQLRADMRADYVERKMKR